VNTAMDEKMGSPAVCHIKLVVLPRRMYNYHSYISSDNHAFEQQGTTNCHKKLSMYLSVKNKSH